MHLSSEPSLTPERQAVCTRNAKLAVRLNAAAMDGDRVLMKRLLAQLLRHGARRSGEEAIQRLAALEDLIQALRFMALTDELTALYNRRGFLRAGTRLLKLASHDRERVTLIYVDVDNLKSVNDSSGHEAGDVLLIRTAQVMRAALGENAVIGRIGGDEFAALILSPDPDEGEGIPQLLQNAVTACNMSRPDRPLSLSIGTAKCHPLEPLSILELLEMADRAMYWHKLKRVPDFGRPAACR